MAPATGMTRRETGVPQQRHASAPASTADETAMTGNDGSTDFNLALESNEVLVAMDDAAFKRAVTRCLASHRKIFSAQQNNWASVRLAANLAPILRGVAAEDAKRQDRATARAADAIVDRADPDDPGWERSDLKLDLDVASVTVRRWENGALSASTHEILECLTETLPAVRNVPPYTSYIYSAHENSYATDEVRRRLMLRDNEGELYHVLSDSDGSKSDSGSSQRESDVEGLGDDDVGTERRAKRRTARAGKKERVAARLGKAEPEENVEEAAANRKIDEAEAKQKADEAAANRHWDKRTDYLIYAAAVCLGTTTRCIEAVAVNLRLDPRILRARMRTLQKARNANAKLGGEKNERIDRRGVSIAAVHEGAKAAHEAGVRAAHEYRAALAAAKGDAKVGEEEGDVEIKIDPGSDEEEEVEDEEEGDEGTGSDGKKREKANEKDGGGDDAGPEITRRATRGMADASNVPVRRKDSREMKLWNLVAWRFLAEPDSTDDVHGEGDLPRHVDVDPALDSFRTLYCPRCHLYDCNLHGCGHAQPTVKLGEEEASEIPHHRSKAHMEAVRRAAKEAEESAAAAAAAAAAARKTRGQIDHPALAQPPCGPRCWLMDASARGNASADAPTGASPIRFDAARIKRDAGDAATARAEKARAAPRRSPRVNSPRKQTNTPQKSPRVGGEGPAAGDADAAEAEVDFLNDCHTFDDVDADAVSTPVRQAEPKTAPARWSSFDESYYAKMRVVYGDGGDPCAIARAIDGPPCVEVNRRLRADLQREGEAEASRSEHQSDAEDEEGRGGGGGRGGNRRKGGKRRKGWITQRKRTTTAVIRRRMTDEEDHVWTQYTPCDCGPGGCNPKTCPCMRDGNFCEKYCSCRGALSRCANAFPGCNCKSGTCRTRACPCFAAARECDPDICKRCSHTAEIISHERRDGWPFTDICAPVPNPPNPPNEASAARTDPNEQCGNMKLYLRQHKHAFLGLSGVEGWGCFLKHGARKNELLGEYTGELISQTEADRRGKIYDKLNSSFLFNLNDQWVLDAAVRGNKLKFANHSPTPNCYAKVLMVRGDHRVGIFAKEHIAPGEELTYDYRYEADKAPDWALKRTEMED